MTAAQDHSQPQEQALSQSIRYHLEYSQGVTADKATSRQQYMAVAAAVRDFAIRRLRDTREKHHSEGSRKVCYLSMEFLIGRLLRNNLDNLNLWAECSVAAKSEGIDLQILLEEERDPGLGNGGLGRLAACFLDSMATLGLHGVGYGINYEYGLFEQRIVDGCQQESPDNWFSSGQIWQLDQPEERKLLPVYGILSHQDQASEHGDLPNWVDTRAIIGTPADLPIVGYGGQQVNSLRLYTAHATEGFDIGQFYQGDFLGSEKQQVEAKAVSKVLYPPDHTDEGKELRFIQEYFFVACALRDILDDLAVDGFSIDQLADQVAIQLNDTHPAIAIPELMRLLIVDHDTSWDEAWSLCQRTFSYTNHTLLPEALEVWSVGLFEKVLPLHLQIIYRINQQFLDSLPSRPGDSALNPAAVSIVGEQGVKHIRMANLAFVTAHRVNGVARMHTDLVKSKLAPEFDQLFPEKICNVTNGVTPRRWLKGCNPKLSDLITDAIGQEWIRDLSQLSLLNEFHDDSGFREQLFRVKQSNKLGFANYLSSHLGRNVNPHSLFDVQIKRIHEYKRQLLSAFHIAHIYLSVVDHGIDLEYPRTFLFAGKAAPGYDFAKLIIAFIGALDCSIRNNSAVSEQLRVLFVPDYSVSVAERIIPSADLSEQISTAGYEASGTGNMKLSMNGALTIGTLDGANVEIAEQVGNENIFIFGHEAHELDTLAQQGYNPQDWLNGDSPLNRVLEETMNNRFSPNQPGVFAPLVDAVRHHGDQYFIAADFDDYLNTQKQVASRYGDRDWWLSSVTRNIAGTGMFSSDRSVRDYFRDVWALGER